MEYREGNRIVARYVCAVCWQTLVWPKGEAQPICAKYEHDHEGYVTRTFVDNKRVESYQEARDVRPVLQAIGIEETHSEEENLKALGY